jgi:hypothetical protein
VEHEMPWFARLGLSELDLKTLMVYKSYLRGLRRVTKEFFTDDIFSFDDWLRDGTLLMQRLRNHYDEVSTQDQEQDSDSAPPDPTGASTSNHSRQGEALPTPYAGDDGYEDVRPTRKRKGPSLQLDIDLSSLCDGEECKTCGVWVDVAAEVGSQGKVTVWNHSNCLDIV